jgi:hypothetical protein
MKYDIKFILLYNKMTNINFLDNLVNKINEVRENEFNNFNLKYDEIIIEKKLVNENSKEYSAYKNNLKKKSLIEKNKPKNFGKKDNINEDTNTNIDILEDDIFNSNNNLNENKDEEIKLDLNSLNKEKKLDIINEFLQRKSILLEDSELSKINDIVNDDNNNFKKYFTISKMYQQITKISFIKKLENGSYIVDLSENKSRKSKKFFLK